MSVSEYVDRSLVSISSMTVESGTICLGNIETGVLSRAIKYIIARKKARALMSKNNKIKGYNVSP